jgi:hypothetical protein
MRKVRKIAYPLLLPSVLQVSMNMQAPPSTIATTSGTAKVLVLVVTLRKNTWNFWSFTAFQKPISWLQTWIQHRSKMMPG